MRRLLPLLTLLACAPVTPVPTPLPPLPDDPLAGTTFDCEKPWVELERPTVAGPVRDCASGEASQVAPCLSRLVTDESLPDRPHPDTVGCEARDLGMRASPAVAAGTATTTDAKIAENVRAWIRSMRVSFR